MLRTLLIAGVFALSANAAMAQSSGSGGLDQILGDTPTVDTAAVVSLCTNGPARTRGEWGASAASQLIQFGWSAIESNDGESALKLFSLALSAGGPERPDAYWGLGIASHVAGRDQAAIDACFGKLQALLPNDAGAFADHGRVLDMRGAPKLAIEKFEMALARDPNHVEAHIGMARSHMALGDEATAQIHVKRVEELTLDK